TSPTVHPQARQLALSFLDRYHEETDPERYHRAGLELVRQPYLNAFQYRFALRQAEAACRLAPAQSKYLTTRGCAQYRLGQYQEALDTLTHAGRANEHDPANVAFLAMAQRQLGQQEQAQTTLARFQQVVIRPEWAKQE